MIPPALAIVIVLLTLGVLIAGIRVVQRRFGWGAELSRKSVHICMGFVCLSFPWLFHQAWAVGLLAVGTVMALAAVRRVPAFKTRIGQVLGGVERESWGELFFPLAVAFVFWLARGSTLLFCVPVLILTLADATAALVGRRYGYARYETDDGWKTIEGSAAFFVVAFLCTVVPLWFTSQTGQVEGILIASLMGFILVLIEAIAWRGLDNLFIPIVSWVCLARMLQLPARDLVIQLVVLVAAILALGFWRKTTRLTQSAMIGSALIFFVTWVVGDWHWLIAPLVTSIGYTFLCRQPVENAHRHTVHAIACIGGIGLCWLCVWQVAGNTHGIYAYGVAYAANLGMISLTHFSQPQLSRSVFTAILKSIPLCFWLMAVPYLVVWHAHPGAIPMAAVSFLLVVGALAVFAAWQPLISQSPNDADRWTRQGVISAVASSLAFLFALHLDL
jgi:phytol kinase